MQVCVLVLQPGHLTQESCICSGLYYFLSVTAVQWSTYTEQNVRPGPKFMHHLPLVMHANFYKNQSLCLSKELPHEKFPHVSLELTMLHFFLTICFYWDFFSVCLCLCANIQHDIILSGRWQLSLRHDKIVRNTPPAVPHCFNIVLFNKKMTPSVWMTTLKWTINILYIRKSWKLKYTA